MAARAVSAGAGVPPAVPQVARHPGDGDRLQVPEPLAAAAGAHAPQLQVSVTAAGHCGRPGGCQTVPLCFQGGSDSIWFMVTASAV